MNKSRILLVLLLVCVNASAQFVPLNSAKQIAEQFLQTQVDYVEHALGEGISNNISRSTNMQQSEVQPAIYVFAADSQWAVVSADERTLPILAYSTEGPFPSLSEMAPAMLDLLDGYQLQIQVLREQGGTNSAIQSDDQHKKSASSLPSHVSPLLEGDRDANRWKQKDNNGSNPFSTHTYNKFCPVCNSNQHATVGCVALAMSQILWRWKWPAAAHVTNYSEGYLLREYDWTMMPSKITNSTPLAEVNMLAHLLADVGHALNMQYGCEGSGAQVEDVSAAFSSFSMHSDPALSRSNYSDSDWKNILKTQLAQNCPILYFSGSIDNYAHCFVVDGYDILGRFHVNLGHGDQAAYFKLDNIHESNGGPSIVWNVNHKAICNIYPNTWECLPFYLNKEFWSLPLYDSFQYPGGITVYNAIVERGGTKNVSSGEYVRILPGSHFKSGSNVRISIADTDCDGFYYDMYSNNPARTSFQTDDSTSPDSRLSKSNGIDIFPNPAQDIITVSGCASLTPELKIYSIQGQLILTTVGTSVDVVALPSGLYILACKDNGHTYQTKFYKE